MPWPAWLRFGEDLPGGSVYGSFSCFAGLNLFRKSLRMELEYADTFLYMLTILSVNSVLDDFKFSIKGAVCMSELNR